jgi:hypothetical protein
MRADYLRSRAAGAACLPAAVFVHNVATAADPLPRVEEWEA